MTGLWKIITPLAMTNHIGNPSFERGVTGWSNYTSGGGTGSQGRTPDAALQGFYGYRITKSGTTGEFGKSTSPVDATVFVADDVITTSLFCRVASGARVRLEATVTTSGGAITNSVDQDGPFTGRIEVTLSALDDTGISSTIKIFVPADYSGQVDFDGLQMEVNSAASEYFDGDSDGCYWNGEFHNSTSTRQALRPGGQAENFDDYSFYILDVGDSGMASLRHELDDYALQDGALYRDSRAQRRILTLTGELIGSSLADLHDKRRALIDLIKPDLDGPNTPFWLVYSGSGENLRIKVRYDTGLDNGRRNGFSERIAIRFIAEDPYWRTGYNVGVDLTARKTTTITAGLMARVLGEWQELHATQGPDSGQINAIVFHEGKIYIGGSFPSINSDTDMSYIAEWDGSSWNALGTGANNNVLALAVAPNGDLYAGGSFTAMGGVADTAYIARWDGSSWNAMGTGANGAVYTLAPAVDDYMYIGGSFTQLNGGSHPRIGRWHMELEAYGTIMSSGVDDGIVYALAVAPDGDLYLGGSFTSCSSVSNTAYLARWDGSAFNAISTGMDDNVWSLAFAPNGNLFVGGEFTDAGGVTVDRIAEWNGITFLDMNGGYGGSSSPIIYELDFTTEGILIIGGTFTEFGGVESWFVVFWNGSTYYPVDQYISSGGVLAFTSGGKYELVIGGSGATHYAAYNNSVSNNGTRAASPRFHIKPADDGASFSFKLFALEAYEAEAVLRFQPWAFALGEELWIDTRPGQSGIVSNLTGNQIDRLNRSSNLADFKLRPGPNSLLAFALYNNATYDISMIWDELFWSADGHD